MRVSTCACGLGRSPSVRRVVATFRTSHSDSANAITCASGQHGALEAPYEPWRKPGPGDERVPHHRPSGHLTGKTEYLARATRDAVTLRGRRVAIASLTNTAAAEIRARTGIADRSMVAVGTLHKLCMEALGIGGDALVANHLDEWNDGPGRGSWQLTGKDDAEEGRANATQGDRYLGRIEDARHRMQPLPLNTGLAQFHDAYTAWKNEHGYHDFTDCIWQAVQETSAPSVGGHIPDTLVLDECQDSTRLELHLVREVWGKSVERVILAGDPDQTIYEFRSAEPRVFLDYEPEHAKTLGQSYRCPRAVHAYAQSLIRRNRDRADTDWAPRDEDGELIRSSVHARDPEGILALAERYLCDGTVMVIGSTRYAVQGVVSAARAAGVPFGNPWAPKRAEWSPLAPARRGATSSRDRLLAFLAPGRDEWSRDELLKWIPALRAKGLLAHGALTGVETRLSDPWTSAELVALFASEDHALAAYQRDPAWLAANAKPASQRLLSYLAAVHRRYGVDGLTDRPKLCIGTIHSVKGGSSETVILIPDVTPRMYREGASREGMEAQVRRFYVGATRARQRLVLASASGRLRFPL